MGRKLENMAEEKGFGTLIVDTIRVVRDLPEGNYDSVGVMYIKGSHKYPSTFKEAFKLFKRLLH